MEFRILGPLEAVAEGRVVALNAAKQRALLAILLLHANELVSSDRLIDDLWGGRPPATAAKIVQKYVSQLRRSLGRVVIRTASSAYELRADAGSYDLHRFEQLLGTARAANPAEANAMLREALSLWRGPPLAEFAYAPWAQPEIVRLEELRVEALQERIETDLALGADAELVPELELLVGQHPLRERLRGQLMLALYRSGRQADALAAYRDARRSLVETLGIEPTLALRQLERSILDQDPALDRVIAEPPTTGAAEGELGIADFPPMKTMPETNLPVPATTFLGREREIAQIVALLRRRDVRLVTLTGPGGSGKTRLSLQAAAAAAYDYDRGVWWVPLATLADAALVETAAAQALGSKDTLSATVGDQRLLLVLDNFEHLVAAAAGLAETIRRCPHLTMLVTSREPLHIDGEWEVAVDPLRESEAVDLFMHRALAVSADFAADGEVAEICRRLDCLPLAIELAAARMKALSSSALLKRLEPRLPLLAGGSRSAPERQRTLRATIAWSHDLLTVAEQDLFARLAVFAGGCTLDAAEEICNAEVDEIASLVDKSMLRRTGDRYWMLETIREFAAGRLDELAHSQLVRDRHASWYLTLAERARPELRAWGAREWLERLDAEHANVRASLDHLLESGDADGALRLSGAIWLYWQTYGHWTEGRRYLAAAVALGADREPERLVDSLWGGALLALWQGDDDEGERLATRLYEISKTATDREHVYSVAIYLLAIVATRRGERDRALAWFEESLAIGRRGGDQWLLSIALNNLGDLFMFESDYGRATELFEESLAIGEARGDLDRRARALGNLGWATRGLGDLARARDYYRGGLEAATEIGLVEVQLWTLFGLAALEAEAGDARAGARLFGRARELDSHLDAAHDDEDEALERQTLAMLKSALGPERLASEISAGAALSLEDAIDLALGRKRSATPGAPDQAPKR